MRRAGLSILAIVQVIVLLLHVNGAAAAAFLSDRWDADLVTHVGHPN